MSRVYLCIGAISGLIGVGMGAFGAHAVADRLTPEMLAVYETAARYQLIHALAILFAGYVAGHSSRRLWGLSAGFFTAGTVLFSGSLYALSLTGIRGLGAITPLGGLCFLTGWAFLFFSALLDKGPATTR